jgi:hypothetical protein
VLKTFGEIHIARRCSMRPNTRACIAYIAGRLVTGRNASSVYDYSQSKHILVSGTVEESRIQIYDYDRGCHFSGNRNGEKFSLYDYGDSHFVDLSLDGAKFKGYDYGTSSHFSGEVKGNSISIYLDNVTLAKCPAAD